MTSLRRSNKQSLMAVIVIMATMTMTLVQAETTGALSAPIRDCLNEFRRLRDEAYSSHHLSEVVFCKNSAGQTKGHDNGEEANRNLRYAQEHGLAGDKEAAMNALRTNNYLWTTEIVVLIDKLTDPTCNVFMRDIIGKLDMKQMKKNERQLRQKIDELHLSSGSGSSSGEGGDSTRTIVLGDDFYPYCQLMSFSEPEKLIEHVHGLLNNKRWASKEYERLFEPVQRLNNIISSYRRAQTGRPERKSQLAEEFSVNVRWRMNNKDDRFLAASIKGGFAGIEHDHGLGSLWSKHGVEAALDVMRRRYGRDKSSRIIAKRVGKELKPACNAFVNRFKHVFEGFYIKRDAKKTLKTIADRQHLKEVQEFTKGLHTYLCCYLITKGDPGNRFLKQIKNYDAPALDDGDDHLERANGIDGEFETHVTGEDSAEPEDTGMETGKFGSKHERDENDENDEIVD